MQKIFVSYSRLDESQAKRIYEALAREGFSPWFDKISLLPGQIWESEIRKAIKESNFVVLVLSQNSVNKQGYFHKEIQFALDVYATIPAGNIFLIPTRLDDCSVPEMLNTIQWVDMFPDWDDGFKKICDSLNYQKMKEIVSRPIAELAPFPPDILISSPTENLPPKISALLGSWAGRWGVLPSQLVIEQIFTENQAQVVYTWGESPSGKFKAGWARNLATISTDGTISWGTQTAFSFKIDIENDALLGTRESGQNKDRIVMRRNERVAKK